jgi:predicted enzyme involved in methoxymalonyl-ACP biosynthesis
MELPDQTVIPRRKVHLKIAPENFGKKVLVLDLDETLYHCEETRMSPDDMEIDISSEGEQP